MCIFPSLPESVHLRSQASWESSGGGGGYLTNIWVSGWAAEGLEPWPGLGQKNPKIHALFGTTLEDIGQNASRFCFKAILILATVVEQIHEKVTALYTWTTNKIHLENQINPCKQYPVDRLTRNCIPCLGQTHTRLYTLFRTERSKTIPGVAAHPCIGYIMKYPRGRVCGIKQSRPADIIGLEGVSSRFRTSSE